MIPKVFNISFKLINKKKPAPIVIRYLFSKGDSDERKNSLKLFEDFNLEKKLPTPILKVCEDYLKWITQAVMLLARS